MNNPFSSLPAPRGLDPLYFDRRRSLLGAFASLGIQKADVKRIIDVGASIGETTNDFLDWFPSSSVVAFEPLPSSFKKLSERRENAWTSRQVYLRPYALSDQEGRKLLHESELKPTTSSFAPINRFAGTRFSHRGLSPDSPSAMEVDDSDVRLVEVPVTTLDRHFAGYFPEKEWTGGGIDLLKVDTQSWDLYVLRGGERLLRETKLVLLEWIFDDVYGKPSPLHELDFYMESCGFHLWDISHIYKDLQTLQTLWVDFIYIKVRC